jgi:hypothetical protein
MPSRITVSYASAADFLITELHRCYYALVYAGSMPRRDALDFWTMTSRRHTSAYVTLAAAYAVVLQAILLSICGALAEGQPFGVSSLCAPSQAGERQPAPAGRGDDCLSACLACCCGMAPPPEPGVTKIDLRAPAQRITPPALSDGATPLGAERAHRSRGPPLA